MCLNFFKVLNWSNNDLSYKCDVGGARVIFTIHEISYVLQGCVWLDIGQNSLDSG